MKKFAILSLMAVLALSACDNDDDPTGNQETAQVRIVNATTGTNFAAINALEGSDEIVAGVAQGTGSNCSNTYEVTAGNRTINFRTVAGGTTNQETITYNFLADHKYTIILYGTNADVRAMVIEDEATQTNATAGNRRFRFINASTNNTAVDVFARPNTTGAPTGAATSSNIASGTAAGGATVANNYFNIPTANTFFQFYNTGATTTLRQTATLSTTNFPNSGNATILLTDTGTFQINNCS